MQACTLPFSFHTKPFMINYNGKVHWGGEADEQSESETNEASYTR